MLGNQFIILNIIKIILPSLYKLNLIVMKQLKEKSFLIEFQQINKEQW